MSGLRSLEELWEESDRRPFLAEDSRDGNCIGFVGVAGGFAFDGSVEKKAAHLPVWKLVKPAPKLVPHWPMLYRMGSYTVPQITRTLYPEDHPYKPGDKTLHGEFIRLVTEYPPIMLEVSNGTRDS